MKQAQAQVNQGVFTLPPRLAGAMETFERHGQARGLSPRTIGTHQERLQDFGRYVAGRGLDLPDVSQFVVADYFVELRERPNRRARRNPRRLSPSTVASVHVTLHAFARFCVKARLAKHDFMADMPKPKVPQLPPVAVPDDVLLRVIDGLNPKRPPANYPPKKWRFVALRNKALVLVLIDSLLRNAEVRGLDAGDVSLAQGTIAVRRAKGGKFRVVPFSGETARALRQYLDERAKRFRLPHDRGVLFLDLSGRPLSKTALRQVFRGLKARAGYEGRFSPHALRHTGAKAAIRGGADVFSLAKVLGHSTLAVTRRYAELDDAEIARQHRVWSPATRLLRAR